MRQWLDASVVGCISGWMHQWLDASVVGCTNEYFTINTY